MNLYNFPSRAHLLWVILWLSSVCPFRSKFSHLPRTLNLALPVCPATSSSPVTSCLFPAWSVGLSCSFPSLGSFPSDLTRLCWHTCLCKGARQGCQEHRAQHTGSSRSLTLQQLGGPCIHDWAFHFRCTTVWVDFFSGIELSRAGKQFSCFSTDTF